MNWKFQNDTSLPSAKGISPHGQKKGLKPDGIEAQAEILANSRSARSDRQPG
jgi:hypothetical protein